MARELGIELNGIMHLCDVCGVERIEKTFRFSDHE